ncbi:hypothetical protein LPB136_09495 [Tenacibaculum todarodis]|uniref:Lipoprotein n=1 Tax=Tenacibaculum todarodis TaxID=1850252 RepID=A0A1L3JK94_9FLAO|nr:hypothetical protein [Tenacibaculum todarodis]APG65580.1 hypothetical protein LPB136_09495 [Tenacibaculum todarodis]
MKATSYLILVVIFFSCQKEKIRNYEEENTYQIVTSLLDEYKSYIVLPPMLTRPPGAKNQKLTIQDSLWIYKYHYNQLINKKTIAVNKNIFGVEKNYSFRGKCSIVDDKLLEKFNSLKENKKIDVSKVTIYGKDTLIQYKEEFKKLPWSGFNKMDLLLNFSRIAFNKEYNKAIIIVGASKGRLNGVSTLLYLEKVNYVWQIKCQKGLSIS